MRLVRYSREDLIQEIKTTFPNGGTGNLVRLSRFPLGLQSGWSADDSQVASDPNVLGASGTPALRLQSDRTVRVTAAPFPVRWSFEPHVLSLSLRGQAQGRVIIRGERQELAVKPFTLSGDGWKRVVIPFTPLFLGKSHDFQIESSGPLWLDAVQVERGTEAHDYTPPTHLEVSLACPPSDTALARIQLAGDRSLRHCWNAAFGGGAESPRRQRLRSGEVVGPNPAPAVRQSSLCGFRRPAARSVWHRGVGRGWAWQAPQHDERTRRQSPPPPPCLGTGRAGFAIRDSPEQ